MRVTMVSKACVIASYRSKLEALASLPGVELSVIVPAYWREGRRRLVLERGHTSGYRLVVAPMAFNGSFHVHYYPTLSRILREERPEIFHIDEEPYNLATYLALRSARAVGSRTLFFTWQNLLRRYPFPFRQMETYVYRHADAAIAGNRDAAEVLRTKGYAGPVRVIPQFGVDPECFRPARPTAEERPFTVGYAGRLVEQKGLGVLAEALAGWEGDWRLLLCGSGPLQRTLSARFAALGLAGRVSFCGPVSSLDMPSYLAQMDVLVLPSLSRRTWKEQFGRVLIEAMACQIAVVGSDSGEIPNVVGDGGLIFHEGNSLELRQCLESLRQDEALRSKLAKVGRARVLEHFTQANIASQTAALYREIVTRPASDDRDTECRVQTCE